MAVVAAELDVDARLPDALRKGVVHRVLHQLVQHDCERGRNLSGQLSGVALDMEANGVVVRGRRLFDETGEGTNDLVEGHHVAGFT